MPLINVLDKFIPEPHFNFKDKYWPLLTTSLIDKYGTYESADLVLAQNILLDAFDFMLDNFRDVLNTQKRASFVFFIQHMHENTIELHQLQVKGQKLPCDEELLAGTRRWLKIILEQSVLIDWVGCPDFKAEANMNAEYYIEVLDELLYLGYQAQYISEFIAKSKMIPESIGVLLADGEFKILTFQPFPLLYSFIYGDINSRIRETKIHNSLNDLEKVFRDDIGIQLQDLSNLSQSLAIKGVYSFFKFEDLINVVEETYKIDKGVLELLFKGLLITRKNVLSLDKCVLTNQDMNRHTFRPILELNIDSNNYCILGQHKFSESITSVVYNCLPFGQCFDEWIKIEPLKSMYLELSKGHDKVLEEPIWEILKENYIPFDKSVKSLITSYSTSVENDIKGVGEIDLIFIDEEQEIIFVGECKHNRSRYDYNNWRRDYSNFINKYESKLDSKVDWISAHLQELSSHFKIKHSKSFDFSSFRVVGFFVINAPTIYMYNGKYRALTISDFKNHITGNFINNEFMFKNEETGITYHVKHPFFQSLIEQLK